MGVQGTRVSGLYVGFPVLGPFQAIKFKGFSVHVWLLIEDKGLLDIAQDSDVIIFDLQLSQASQGL